MKPTVTFEGEIGGDGDSMLWRGVPEDQFAAVVGPELYAFDKEHGEPLDVLYPGNVMTALGVVEGKRYRFTVTAEEV